jgi:serine phosphatase RsbU (regulator of sigma subunit)
MPTYQKIIEHSPLPMATTEGPSHQLRSANIAFCASQGKVAHEMIGHPLSEAISQEEFAGIRDLLDRVYEGQKSGFVNDLAHSDLSGPIQYSSYLVWGLPKIEGNPELLVIQVTDSTQQYLANTQSDRNSAQILSLNNEMREMNEQLVLSGLRIQNSADRNRAIAEALQYSILWEHPEKLFESLRVAVCYEPADDIALVGGDLFDAFNLPNKCVALIVGDVTGKGLAAAARTVEIRFALRAFAQLYTDPEDLIAHLNQLICSYHNEDDLGNALVVLSVIVVNPETGKTQIASGGAELPLILRASGEVEEVPVSGLILGIDHNANYQTVDVQLAVGDLLLMSTDGITETRRGSDFFGTARMLDIARKNSRSDTLHSVGQSILDEARTFGGGTFGDDVCLLIARREPPQPF